MLAQPWWQTAELPSDSDEGADGDATPAPGALYQLAPLDRIDADPVGMPSSRRQRARRQRPNGTSEHAARPLAPVAVSSPPRPLNEANRGFAMLKSLGWTPGDGLGAGASGEVLPVAATMQTQAVMDRRGLGRA